MCGGIVAALSMSGNRAWMPGIFVYHFGRLITYTLLGIILGLIGSLTVYGAGMGNIQGYLSIITGLIIILFALQTGGWISGRSGYLYKISIPSGLLTAAARQGSGASWGLLGLVNGLLPCGMVYAALALALRQAGPLNGALSMFAFGLGTMPAMTIFAIIIRRINPAVKGRVLKLASVVIVLFGVFTIYRGIARPHIHGPSTGSDMCQTDPAVGMAGKHR